MEVFNFFMNQFRQIMAQLNQYQFAGVPLFTLLCSFIVVSIVISVFWRGGRG